MRPEDLKEFRDQEPFTPFRIVFTGGRSFDIPHRDFLMVGKHVIKIGLSPDPQTGLPERIIRALPLHVVRLESVQPAA